MRECWNIDELGQRYREFIERFRLSPPPLRRMTPEESFQVRTLLIH